jgi:hypothetical protein
MLAMARQLVVEREAGAVVADLRVAGLEAGELKRF